MEKTRFSVLASMVKARYNALRPCAVFLRAFQAVGDKSTNYYLIMKRVMKLNRRDFLKKTAFAASAFTIPSIVPSTVFGKTAPSNKVNIGCIGVGNRGSGLMKNALYNSQGRVVAVSDCFASRRQGAINTINDIYKTEDSGAKAYADFRQLLAREDIDAVTVATPDHWHVPIAIAAVKAGKDLYLEKPLGVSLDEAYILRKLVQEKSAVFQYGTQQRSDYYFRFACELARNGYIGELKSMDVWCAGVGNSQYLTKFPPVEPVPADIDYDRWIGPAPYEAVFEGSCKQCRCMAHL